MTLENDNWWGDRVVIGIMIVICNYDSLNGVSPTKNLEVHHETYVES